MSMLKVCQWLAYLILSASAFNASSLKQLPWVGDTGRPLANPTTPGKYLLKQFHIRVIFSFVCLTEKSSEEFLMNVEHALFVIVINYELIIFVSSACPSFLSL